MGSLAWPMNSAPPNLSTGRSLQVGSNKLDSLTPKCCYTGDPTGLGWHRFAEQNDVARTLANAYRSKTSLSSRGNSVGVGARVDATGQMVRPDGRRVD